MCFFFFNTCPLCLLLLGSNKKTDGSRLRRCCACLCYYANGLWWARCAVLCLSAFAASQWAIFWPGGWSSCFVATRWVLVLWFSPVFLTLWIICRAIVYFYCAFWHLSSFYDLYIAHVVWGANLIITNIILFFFTVWVISSPKVPI